MSLLTVALLQLPPDGNDLSSNMEKGERYCRRAKALGADIALFPEMWSTGYVSTVPFDHAALGLYRAPELWDPTTPTSSSAHPVELIDVWQDLAITRDDPFIVRFQQLARELDMAIAITYLEHWEPLPRNSMSLIDRHGDIVMTYAKTHTCAWSLHEASLTPGEGFEVCVLDTVGGPVNVGAMICYDREFPESARVLMLKGAELILTPNACHMSTPRLTQLRSRAFENMLGVAMTNYAGRGWGHSVAYDGIDVDRGGERDMLVIEAGEREGVYPATFDLAALREHRRRKAWGNAFRRPHLYDALTGMEVEEPFIRVGADGKPLIRMPNPSAMPK